MPGRIAGSRRQIRDALLLVLFVWAVFTMSGSALLSWVVVGVVVGATGAVGILVPTALCGHRADALRPALPVVGGGLVGLAFLYVLMAGAGYPRGAGVMPTALAVALVFALLTGLLADELVTWCRPVAGVRGHVVVVRYPLSRGQRVRDLLVAGAGESR